MNLRVHIDHLRIDGADLTPADAPRLRDALADELRRQLADHHAREHRDVPRLRAPDVAATSDVQRLARDVARSLVRGLADPGPGGPR